MCEDYGTETIEHFLMYCDGYSDLRGVLFNICSDEQAVTIADKMRVILGISLSVDHDRDVLITVANTVYEMHLRRLRMTLEMD